LNNMGCGASAQPAAATEAKPIEATEAKDVPVEKPAENNKVVVDSETTTATPPPEGDDEEKQKKEEEAGALKIQSNFRGKQARKEVAAKKAGQEDTAKPDEATADVEVAPKEEPTSDNAAEPALTEDEAAKQKAEEEAAALKIQSNHRGKQARKEVEAKKASLEDKGKPDEATADTAAAPKEEASTDNAAEPALTEEEAAKQKAEEEAAALKIQSNHRGKQARKEVAAMKDSADEKPADTEAAGETQPEASAPAEGQ
jgi:hypothetical protein